MELSATFFTSTVLALLISSASAQSPPAPFLPPTASPGPAPAPAPAPAPHHVNLTYLLSVAGPFSTFLDYLLQTKVIDTFQNQANNTKEGITIFVPKDSAFAKLKKSVLANLTEDQLRTLVQYHALPKFYSLSDFKSVSNPISTFAGGQYSLNVTDNSGTISVLSNWATPKITSSVYTTAPVAVYQVDRVLLPLAIFATDPPLAPAPAPAPESGKPSDLAPSKSEAGTSPKSSESSNNNGAAYYSSSIGLFNLMVLALSCVLMLVL